MKKTLSLLALASVLTTSTVFAQSNDNSVEGADYNANAIPTQIEFHNNASTGKSVWVTIYNVVGRIGDARCVQAGKTTTFVGYMPPFSYEVRAQVQDQADCGGRTIHDESHSQSMGICGINAEMSKDTNGQYHLNLSGC